jgi:hypothetical protein
MRVRLIPGIATRQMCYTWTGPLNQTNRAACFDSRPASLLSPQMAFRQKDERDGPPYVSRQGSKSIAK